MDIPQEIKNASDAWILKNFDIKRGETYLVESKHLPEAIEYGYSLAMPEIAELEAKVQFAANKLYEANSEIEELKAQLEQKAVKIAAMGIAHQEEADSLIIERDNEREANQELRAENERLKKVDNFELFKGFAKWFRKRQMDSKGYTDKEIADIYKHENNL